MYSLGVLLYQLITDEAQAQFQAAGSIFIAHGNAFQPDLDIINDDLAFLAHGKAARTPFS